MLDFLDRPMGNDARFLVDLGLNHEQQHQELVLMDIKHVLSRNPLLPVYRATRDDVALAGGGAAPLSFVAYDGGVTEIGHHGPGFAFANWAGARLPTEAEWEVAAREHPVDGNFLDLDRLHPEAAIPSGDTPVQFFGDVWEWTQSPYSPYPGFRPAAGAVGEYNGKFMV